MAIEIVGGLLTRSVALVADEGPIVTDASARGDHF